MKAIFFIRFLCAITLVPLLACSADKPVEKSEQNHTQTGEGSYLIEIIPLNVTRNSTIYLVHHGFTLSDAKIEWFVNGSPVLSALPDQFNTDGIRKHDKVQSKVIIKDKEIVSNIIEIKNAPPEINQAELVPEGFKPVGTLRVEATESDIDGDAVTLTYEWNKNGEPAGSSKQFKGKLKKGDKLSIKVTPFDGEAYGRSLVLRREVGNMPPIISESMEYNFDGKIYTYQVKATDPDGDPLMYSLKTAPSAMTINPSAGLIKWNVPPGFIGKASFTVSVIDGHGGEASQNLTFEIKSEQKINP